MAKECTMIVIDSPKNEHGAKHEHADFLEAHPDAIKVQSVKDMVDKVINKKTEDKCDCIKKLILLGHGGDGKLTVGGGKNADDGKYINSENEKGWIDELERLKKHLCKDAVVVLFGCDFAKGPKGQRKLQKIANLLGVTCKAPSGEIKGNDDPDSKSDVSRKPEG
jgi:hypothetical protein